MTFRGTIPDFQLANPLYVGAQVSFFTVDSNGHATTTLATLYADTVSIQTLANPQILDGEGKFEAPVYIEVPVIASVVGATVGTHTTGIIGLSPDTGSVNTVPGGTTAGAPAIFSDTTGYLLEPSNRLLEFNTVAELQAKPLPPGTKFVRLSGYYAPADGGGGLRAIQSIDPGHYGAVPTGDGRWAVLEEPIVTLPMMGGKVLDFSALFDNTQRIADALTYFGHCKIPRGEWLYTFLPFFGVGQELFGEGRAASKLSRTIPATTAVQIGNNDGSGVGARIHDLCFTDYGASGGNGICLQGAQRAELERLQLFGIYGSPLLITGDSFALGHCSSASIDDVYINGPWYNHAVNLDTYFQTVFLRRLEIANGPDRNDVYGIRAFGTGAGWITDCDVYPDCAKIGLQSAFWFSVKGTFCHLNQETGARDGIVSTGGQHNTFSDNEVFVTGIPFKTTDTYDTIGINSFQSDDRFGAPANAINDQGDYNSYTGNTVAGNYSSTVGYFTGLNTRRQGNIGIDDFIPAGNVTQYYLSGDGNVATLGQGGAFGAGKSLVINVPTSAGLELAISGVDRVLLYPSGGVYIGGSGYADPGANNLAVLGKINNVTLTQPATGATLTIDDGKTLHALKSLQLDGVDGKTFTLGASFAVGGTDGGQITFGAAKTLQIDNTLEFAGTDGTTITFQGTDTYVGRSTTDTLTNKTLTSPTINGGSHTAITSLGLRDTSAAFDVTLAAASSSPLTVGRTLTLDLVNASRTLKFSGDLTLAGAASLPAIAQGDLWYGSAAGVISALAKSTGASRFLNNSGTSNNPAWAQPTLSDLAAGTLTADILFTDATYDIGKNGATRPRDLFASRNGTFGGDLTWTGVAFSTSTQTQGSSAGAFGAGSTNATMRSKAFGKLTFVQYDFTTPALGTASGDLTLTLPTSWVPPEFYGCQWFNRSNGTNGFGILSGYGAGSQHFSLRTTAGGFPATGDSQNIVVFGWIELS
jgi:catechol 2,3-dioxygenase-like lactoylglutathione lyase family enzyme